MTPKRLNASTDDVELAYGAHRADDSDSRLLLLIHGGASNHTRWAEFAELTTLNKNWNIIAPDMRGNGASMTRDNLNIDTWCADLNDILNAEHAQTVVIIGHSLGAQLAIHLAHQHPEQAHALVLIDTVYRSSLTGRSLWVSRHPRLIKAAVNIVLTLNRLGFRRRHLVGANLQELDQETRKALQGAESFEEIAKRYSALGPILKHIPLANYLRQAIATVSPLPELEEIELPVLSILSSGSTVGNLELTEREIARFKQGETATIHANHWPLTEAPEEVRSVIENWLIKKFPN